MLIFDADKDLPLILDFTLKTFFRHFSLYEFSFKPRRELILKCESFLSTEMNADIVELHDMQPLGEDEADKYKSLLSIYQG